MRKLASIRRISALQPIEGKDRIVLATVNGWSVIVKKDEFAVGDLCVYIEIDSVLPQRPEFEFLRKDNFRIKTMRLGKTISQGICFPLKILPAGNYSVDEDVTELLGVTQYEKTMDIDPDFDLDERPASIKYPTFLMRWKWFRNLVLPKKSNTDFPSFISKTDETRIQNIPSILEDREKQWIATEKIDGQSGTYALVRHKSKIPFVCDRFEYIVCSRNKRLPKPDNSPYWSVSDRYFIEMALRYMIDDASWVAIQGEVIGPKIQKNKYCRNQYAMYVFNVIYPEGRLGSYEARSLCGEFGFDFVPILGTTKLPETVDEVLKMAHGQSALHDTLREGIVFRSLDGKDSFEAVDPLFLSNHNE